MTNKEKSTLTHLGKIEVFRELIRKLSIAPHSLDDNENAYLLTCAILFIKHYQKDARFTSYPEFAYWIILKYGLATRDFKPLYDLSTDFGYYPIVNAIQQDGLVKMEKVSDILLNIELDRFKSEKEGYIETLHQFATKQRIFEEEEDEISYVAPTSYGKSSIIVDCIRKFGEQTPKVVIVVPTKSLLMQTYRMIRGANLDRKVIIHDEMYERNSSFIAVFTQERALRLLTKQRDLFFDLVFVDEAHNMFEGDSRSILLSRLIRRNKSRNSAQRIVYLSPLIENSNNLKILSEQEIKEFKIPFTIKEPDIFELGHSGAVTFYNRFINESFEYGQAQNMFEYIYRTSTHKNFLYNYSPRSIEKLSKLLNQSLPNNPVSTEILSLIEILKKEVHSRFYVIDYLKKGIIYIHGKLPDLIKEYLEKKFSEIPGIRFIIANSVILEGMNLPIDSLYIMNTYSLGGKELTNLIGRVNRLNRVFTPQGNYLEKLIPPIHFINSEEFNGKGSTMLNKIRLLRGRIFDDTIKNPTLDQFDFDKLKVSKDQIQKKKALIDSIINQENFLGNNPTDPVERVKHYMIESGISVFYKDVGHAALTFYKKYVRMRRNSNLAQITAIVNGEQWKDVRVLDKINFLFIHSHKITDHEFSRIGNEAARNYYEYHIKVSMRTSLNESINTLVKHFDKRIRDGNPRTYFGSTYGEEPYDDSSMSNTYVNLSKKNETEKVNLAIVKLKIEDDFISFKLSKFIVMLFDYDLITKDEYNEYIYGTTDQKSIDLSKIGLSVSLISRLKADKQLQNLKFDAYKNLEANNSFRDYKRTVGDFYRFELERFIN